MILSESFLLKLPSRSQCVEFVYKRICHGDFHCLLVSKTVSVIVVNARKVLVIASRFNQRSITCGSLNFGLNGCSQACVFPTLVMPCRLGLKSLHAFNRGFVT